MLLAGSVLVCGFHKLPMISALHWRKFRLYSQDTAALNYLQDEYVLVEWHGLCCGLDSFR